MRSITKEIIEHVQRFYGDPVGVTVTQDTPIDELQIDSLDRTELVIHVEREFGVTVPDEKWDECTTVGLLIAAAVDARRQLQAELAKEMALLDDECSASGKSCEYEAQGPNGERQCRYCGAGAGS